MGVEESLDRGTELVRGNEKFGFFNREQPQSSLISGMEVIPTRGGGDDLVDDDPEKAAISALKHDLPLVWVAAPMNGPNPG